MHTCTYMYFNTYKSYIHVRVYSHTRIQHIKHRWNKVQTKNIIIYWWCLLFLLSESRVDMQEPADLPTLFWLVHTIEDETKGELGEQNNGTLGFVCTGRRATTQLHTRSYLTSYNGSSDHVWRWYCCIICIAVLLYCCINFTGQVRKRDGLRYPGKTIHEIITSLQKYFQIQETNLRLIDINKFPTLYYAMDVAMKQSATAGLGMDTRKALAISKEQECRLF